MNGATVGLLALLCGLTAFSGLDAAMAETDRFADPCPSRLAQRVSSRPVDAPAGRDFAGELKRLSGDSREAVVAAALANGDIPDFLRDLQPVVLSGSGQSPEITLCVTPDYLAIGSDTDFLRMPMALPTALSVASRFGFVLPTRKIVDAIYRQAEVRLKPQPMPPTAAMVSTAYFRRHNASIETQRRGHGARLGALIAGHKKDLVLTPRLWRKPGRVAIYGWHRLDGRAIQPLSTVHGADYADYSHGVRLVSAVVTVNGERRSIYEVLADPALAPLLSDEGPMPRLAELIAARGGVLTSAATARWLVAAAGSDAEDFAQLADR